MVNLIRFLQKQVTNKHFLYILIINLFIFIALFFTVEYICYAIYKKTKPSQIFVRDDLFSILNSGQYEEHPDLLFRLKPNITFSMINNVKQETNSSGWRMGHEIKDLTKIEKNNIILLGDSCTFGLGVLYEDTYGAILEKMLNDSSGTKFTVYNFGTPGFTSFQCRKLLENIINHLEPYLIVCYIGANDGARVIEYSDKEYFEHINSKTRLFIYQIVKHSNIYKLLHTCKLNKRISIVLKIINHLPQNRDWFSLALPDVINYLNNSPINENDKLLSNFFTKTRVSVKEFEQNLNIMRKIASKYNSFFIYIPNVWKTNGELKYRNDYLIGDYLDIITELRKYNADEVFFSTVHPTAKGHYIIAKKIFNFIFK